MFFIEFAFETTYEVSNSLCVNLKDLVHPYDDSVAMDSGFFRHAFIQNFL